MESPEMYSTSRCRNPIYLYGMSNYPVSLGATTETCKNWCGPIAMLPRLHQGKIYIQRKLWVCREQKCVPIVGAETPLTCAGWQTTLSHGVGVGQRTQTCVNWGGPIAMVPCLQQSNIYIQRKLRVWREKKCIPLVSGETPPTCKQRKQRVWREQK